MFVNGTFNQPVDDFTANIFKDYEYSSKLVLTLSPSSNEFGDFNFNFTIPDDWELGNYHIVLENGLQFMDWESIVDFRVKEAPDVRSSTTIGNLKAILIKGTPEYGWPSQARIVYDDQYIMLTSLKHDTVELEKVLRSMIER